MPSADDRPIPQHLLPALSRRPDWRNPMPSRVRDHPFLTLLAFISAILILFGRINRLQWWGTPMFVAGIAVLVLAGLLFLVRR
jgi:hypothetical protein